MKFQKILILGTMGLAMLAFLIAGVVNAQITTPVSSAIMASTTIGVPSTGAGGNLTSNILLLTSSALLAIGGMIYLMRTRRA